MFESDSDSEDNDSDTSSEEDVSSWQVAVADLTKKLLHCPDEKLSHKEIDSIANSSKLRDVYNHRWYGSADRRATYFVMYNNHASRAIKSGDQIIFAYGRRTNGYLLEK